MSYNQNFISVVIVAAGMGKRMNSSINKQFIELDNKPILAYTIEVFEKNEYIDEIVVVTREDEMEFCKEYVLNKYDFKKVKSVIPGGKERQDSVYNGILALSTRTDIVLVHDGVRPFIESKTIVEGIKETINIGACVVGVPVKDTIKVVDKWGNIADTPERKMLWAVQTPQCFAYTILLDSYKRAVEDGFVGTDDSSLVERNGYRVKMINGSYNNIKITTPEDIHLAETILGNRKRKGDIDLEEER